MVTKHTESGRAYEIENGRRFIWHADVDEDAGETPFDITIPLRMKLGVLRPLASADLNDVSTMFALLEGIAPGQAEALDDLDVNDFEDMFTTWQNEYTALSGASLGEASRSSS